MRVHTLLFLTLIALPAVPSTADDPAGPATPLDILVRNALEHNPGLAAIRQDFLAAQSAVMPAGALPDPYLDAELTMISVPSPRLSDALSRGSSIGISQTLPFPGKRRLRKGAAEAAAATSALEWEARRARLAGDVTEAALSHALVRRLVELNGDKRSALEAAVRGATSLYAAGRSSQMEVLLAQAALTESSMGRLDLERRLAVAEARLADLSGGALDREALSRVDLPPPEPLPPLDSLLTTALQKAPEARLARSQYETRGLQVGVVEAEARPDFSLSLRYRFDDPAMGGGDFVTLMAGVSLPIFHRRDRYGPLRQEALARREGARLLAQEIENRLRYEITEAWQSAERGASAAALTEAGLVPQARQAYESAAAGYAAGRVDFPTLQRVLSALYEARALAWAARADHHSALARIASIAGGAPSEVGGTPAEAPEPNLLDGGRTP